MTIDDVLKSYKLEKSLLIGFYGGGNFGDELLLEVLANRFKDIGLRDLTVTYQNPSMYSTYHKDFGYKQIPMNSKVQLFKAVFANKNILIGGGGLWGLDVNVNIFILSFLLFISRFVLFKKVFLLGVGYYNSTSKLGRVSAWLAGKSANYIVARDQESYDNFQKFSHNVGIDKDIAWHLPDLNLEGYQDDLNELESRIEINRRTLFISLRRFQPNQQNNYANEIEKLLSSQPDINIILALLEPRAIDEKGYMTIEEWQRKFKNVQITDFSFNPIALYLFLKKHHEKLIYIGPQFHMIITAKLANVPFFPISYDNKVTNLLKSFDENINIVPINKVTQADIASYLAKTTV